MRFQTSVDHLCNIHMPSVQIKNIPKQQQEPRSSWWSWRRSKTSRETTPAPEGVNELTSKTVDTKDTVKEVKEDIIEQEGIFFVKFGVIQETNRKAILKCFFN